MALYSHETAVILLGASTFPSSRFSPSEAFPAAKARIRDYFEQKLRVQSEAILDLFDSEQSADDQDAKIGAFIEDNVNRGIKDVFIYYVGHGSFAAADNSFYLALNKTRTENPTISSITIKALANTVLQYAKKVRTFIILDCCFAAAAGTGFMGSSEDVPIIQLKEAFASKGVALICAASKDSPALIVKDRKITMFSEGLNEALLNGDSSISSRHLSLRQIHKLTYLHIQRLNSIETVRPELISPIQSDGDIADLPHFQNFSFQDTKHDILAQKRKIEDAIVANDLIQVGNQFIDFVRNFDEVETYYMESILISSECNELANEKLQIEREEFKRRKILVYKEILRIISSVMKQNVLSKAS